MDSGSAQSAAGIDPKILDSYQSDTVFTIPWENTGYDQQLDWDTSQDSNQGDSDFAELSRNPSLLGHPGDYHSDDSRYGLSDLFFFPLSLPGQPANTFCIADIRIRLTSLG
jgi:hypothetical protein